MRNNINTNPIVYNNNGNYQQQYPNSNYQQQSFNNYNQQQYQQPIPYLPPNQYQQYPQQQYPQQLNNNNVYRQNSYAADHPSTYPTNYNPNQYPTL